MEIKKITKETEEQAISILKNGGVIVYPTDTLYGLGADARNKKAAQKIYKIKGRDFWKPLSVIVADLKSAEKIAVFNKKRREIFKNLFPGSFTLVLPRKKSLPKILSAGKNTIGLRVPKNKTALLLARRLRGPLISTSANLSGENTPDGARGIYKMFAGKKYGPDLILDGGRLRSKASTIIDLSEEKVKILREGTKKDLKKIKHELKKFS